MYYRVRHALRVQLKDDNINIDKLKDKIAQLNTDKYDICTTKNKKVVLDYILSDKEATYNVCKMRELYQSEKERFYLIFKMILPNIDMNDVKVIKVSYLPNNMIDIADHVIDEFYNEIY